MSFLEKILKKLAFAQKKYAVYFFVVSIILTIFLGFGLTKLNMQTDINKEMPQDLSTEKGRPGRSRNPES